MGPFSIISNLLLKSSGTIMIVLGTLVCVTSGTAWYLHNSNSKLHEQLATAKQQNADYVASHNQQITALTTAIDTQNGAVDTLKKNSDLQIREMGKVQVKVDTMRSAAEQQLTELRKRDVSNFTCTQSIDFLITQAPELKWGYQK